MIDNQDLEVKILERPGSARIFDKSKFPALFPEQNKFEKSAGKFDSFKNRPDPNCSNISFRLYFQSFCANADSLHIGKVHI